MGEAILYYHCKFQASSLFQDVMKIPVVNVQLQLSMFRVRVIEELSSPPSLTSANCYSLPKMALYGIISSLLGDHFYHSFVQDDLEVLDSILLFH